MELEKAFAEAQTLLSHSGHKIFSVSPVRFRTKPAILAIRPPAYKQKLSAYVVRVFHNQLEIGWLQPGANDESIRHELKKKHGKLIRERPRLFSYIRSEHWQQLSTLVAKEQRAEFELLTKDAQLS